MCGKGVSLSLRPFDLFISQSYESFDETARIQPLYGFEINKSSNKNFEKIKSNK